MYSTHMENSIITIHAKYKLNFGSVMQIIMFNSEDI